MQVYRLILETPRPERTTFDTGATYAGCSQDNTAPCDPQQFLSLRDAVDYAEKRGEVPVRVVDVTQTWNILNGVEPITDDMIIKSGGIGEMLSNTNPLVIGGVVVGLLFLFTRGAGRKILT